MSKYQFTHATDSADLEQLYKLAVDYQVAERAFYDGGVQGVDDFLDLMDFAHCFQVWLDGELVGFTWLNGWRGKTAEAHVCLFPTAGEHSVALGREYLRQVLHGKLADGSYYRDSVYGLTPATHRHAAIYARKIGFKKLGIVTSGATVAGEPTDLIVSVADRDTIKE